MGVHSDRWFRQHRGIISPFEENQISSGVSYGVSSFGYDVTLAPVFKTIRQERFVTGRYLDPKNADEDDFFEFSTKEGHPCVVPPHEFILGTTIEIVRVPRHCLAMCVSKSTYARCGIITNVTPLEPEWEGQITMEISNSTSVPVAIWPGEGVVQLVFFEGNEPCDQSYKDRKGRYQGQEGVTIAR